MVFPVVTVTWIWRTPFPYDEIDRPTLSDLSVWYEFIGWFVVNNALFAADQLAIVWIAIHRGNWQALPGETEPLLRGSSGHICADQIQAFFRGNQRLRYQLVSTPNLIPADHLSTLPLFGLLDSTFTRCCIRPGSRHLFLA